MKSADIKIRYFSESGKIITFNVDIDIAKQYKIEETLSSLASASNNFLRCVDIRDKLSKAKKLKVSKEEAKLTKQLKDENTEGLKQIRKAKGSINKAIQAIKKIKLPTKELQVKLKKRGSELKDQLLALDLSPEEKKIVSKEFLRSNKIFESKGISGLINHLKSEFDELEVALLDPLKAWTRGNPKPISIGVAILAAILIIAIIGWFVGSFFQSDRYLGNKHKMEIHDLAYITDDCQRWEIKEEHIVWFSTIEQVEEAINNMGWDGCLWCMPGYHTD